MNNRIVLLLLDVWHIVNYVFFLSDFRCYLDMYKSFKYYLKLVSGSFIEFDFAIINLIKPELKIAYHSQYFLLNKYMYMFQLHTNTLFIAVINKYYDISFIAILRNIMKFGHDHSR
jgi:hypothetical protein